MEAVMARLRHLSLKAPYVQELIIEDYVSHPCQPVSFQKSLFKSSLRLKEAVKLHLVAGSEGELPLSLWDWLVSKKGLKNLSVKGLLSTPDGAGGHLSVDRFRAELSRGTTKVLKLVRPRTIFLSYRRHARCHELETPQFDPYKPSGAENSRIRHVELAVMLPYHFETPLFDFSGIPDADITACFDLDYHMPVPNAWNKQKGQLPVVFAEGIHGYDVSRCKGGKFTTVFRPNLAKIIEGWKPSQAAHLEEEEEETEETEEMVMYRYDL